MTTMNRWVDQRRAVESGMLNIHSRPKFAHEAKTVKEGEMWRMSIVKELATLISQIQNAGLGEQRIRELNDEINRLLKSKYAWEMQIRKLGGPDYSAQKSGEVDGMQLPGGGGYRYFGASKNLPGVRELFDQANTNGQDDGPTRRTREDLTRLIKPDYYGWRDTELEPSLLEDEANREAILKAERAEKEVNVMYSGASESLDMENALLEKKRAMLEKYVNAKESDLVDH